MAAVALQTTGLPEKSARFQALSAFTGTGFTTTEAEMVVNYPLRRRIVSLLMIIGNLGLVTVLATLVASIVRTDGDADAVVAQLAWLGGGLALLWLLILNGTADRLMCSLIRRFLESTRYHGNRRYHRLVQVGDGYSICEYPLKPGFTSVQTSTAAGLNLQLLAVRRESGELSLSVNEAEKLNEGDALIVFGRDEDHEVLGLTVNPPNYVAT